MDNPFESIVAKLDVLSQQVNALGEKLSVLEKIEPQENEVGGIELAMKMTGLGKSAIYTHTSKRSIPFHKAPGSKGLIFYKSELALWIKSGS